MDESRKQFEEWFMDDVVGAAVDFPEFEDGEYVAGEVYDEQLYVMLQAMYMAWTASRAAIALVMPEPFKLAKSSSGLTYYYQDEVDAVLSCAGIKVKE
ncbi:hypothetical protein [Citrobacter sedlakii]|uniref:hypothetical protein n=1 Tax=Citrobacter sedlakii TaxID=67826 RepID=UPI002B22FA62|nr:hypothetical protein [Citrobacter sedlakii]MEB0949300.1 hypothetical protein [Citrobacter sedlakii]